MKSVREGVRRLVHAFDGLCGLLLAIIVVLNLVAVFLRYVVFVPLSWSEEAIRYLSVWMTLVGSAAASATSARSRAIWAWAQAQAILCHGPHSCLRLRACVCVICRAGP